MQINRDFTIQKVGGSYVAVPVGKTSMQFHAMIRLNETGAFLWRNLSEGKDEQGLVDALLGEYDVDVERATTDVSAFLFKLRESGLLDE